jgi:hypothetical protein
MLSFATSSASTLIGSLLLLIGGGSAPSPRRHVAGTLPPAAEDPNIRCAANRATSDAVPFERVDMYAAYPITPRSDSSLFSGPRIFAVIEDPTTWPAVWHIAANDRQPLPVSFDGGVLVLAATTTYGHGPTDLRITSIRRCRRTGVSVVFTIETRPNSAIPMAAMFPSRGIDLVRVPSTQRLGVVLLNQEVHFERRHR